jgi:DNA-binding MarR family transcriptional regulator
LRTCILSKIKEVDYLDISQKIISMYELGATQQEIGSELGITKSAVGKRIRKMIEKGELIKRAPKTKNESKIDPSIDYTDTIIAMYELGATQREIGSEVSLSQKQVSYQVRKLIREGLLQPRPKKEPKSKKDLTRQREPKRKEYYILDLTFSQLELELAYITVPKLDIISCDKDMTHLIIEVEKSGTLPMRSLLKYDIDELEGELVSNLGKRILEDVKDVEWTPQVDVRKVRTEEQDLLYIGKQSLMYFIEGYSKKSIQGFIKYKRPITRQFLNLYSDNVLKTD